MTARHLLLRAALTLLVLHIVALVAGKWLNPPLTMTQAEAVLEGHTFRRDYRPLNEIAPHLQLAVIAAEDQLFANHNGFDVEQIKKAIAHKADGKRMRGASTISQQTAKNVFLWQGRSWIRKGLEAYHTFAIEHLWGKERILETYLNVAEMGPGVFGAQAAARYYFNKDAKHLTANEAALIAAALPNPKMRNPALPSPALRRKADWIQQQFPYLRTRDATAALLAAR